MKKVKKYPYKGKEYTIDHLAIILSKEHNRSISSPTLRKYLRLIEYKYYMNGNFEKFDNGIVEEAYDNFLHKRFEESRLTVYPYMGGEYYLDTIVLILGKKGFKIPIKNLIEILKEIRDKYRIENDEKRFKNGIIEEACKIYIENLNNKKKDEKEK